MGDLFLAETPESYADTSCTTFFLFVVTEY